VEIIIHMKICVIVIFRRKELVELNLIFNFIYSIDRKQVD